MKHFKEFIRDSSNNITITFGNFNPPNIEHHKIINAVYENANGGPYRIYFSKECNEHFPLEYTDKIKYMRKMFPRHARNIIADEKINDLYDALHNLYEQGYTNVTIVMPNIPTQLIECVNRENNTRKYNFKEIKFVSVSTLDIENKLTEAAKNNNFELFLKHMPKNLKENQNIFNSIRSKFGLKESFNFRQHIQLPTLSREREAYVNGELFKVGDVVEISESKEIGQIQRLGSNYVIVETYEGQKQRKWLKDVVKVEESVINKMMEKMDNPCWSNYTMIGTKEKDGKTVPNCVPKKNKKVKSFKEDLTSFKLNGKK